MPSLVPGFTVRSYSDQSEIGSLSDWSEYECTVKPANEATPAPPTYKRIPTPLLRVKFNYFGEVEVTQIL